MRILLTGSSEQLGKALRASLPSRLAGEQVELIKMARQPDQAQGEIGLDPADHDACQAAVIAHQPDWVSMPAPTPPWIERKPNRSWPMPSMPVPPGPLPRP